MHPEMVWVLRATPSRESIAAAYARAHRDKGEPARSHTYEQLAIAGGYEREAIHALLLAQKHSLYHVLSALRHVYQS